jgi:hypothetical protein
MRGMKAPAPLATLAVVVVVALGLASACSSGKKRGDRKSVV